MSPHSSQSVIKTELSSADGLASVFLTQTLTFRLYIADGYRGDEQEWNDNRGELDPSAETLRPVREV